VLAPVLPSPALVCHGRLAPLTPEQERQAALENYAEQRADFGFRYVKRHRDEFGGSEVAGRFPGRPYGPAVRTILVGRRHECATPLF
jgi:hypothetical protein